MSLLEGKVGISDGTVEAVRLRSVNVSRMIRSG